MAVIEETFVASDRPGESSGEEKLSRFNTSIPHPARVYDVWLGGKDNFAADRAAAEAGLKAFPSTVKSVRANRAFLARTVEYLVEEAGIRQFLDIGTGLPSANNTHEVAQAIAPESRIAYVDNDPIVLAHAEALLRSTDSGATDYIDADLREPGKILQEASRTLDFSRPVAVMLIAVLHFVPDEADPYGIAETLMAAVPPGSHLVVSHTAKDIFPEEMAAFARAMNKDSAEKVTLRDREQVSGFFNGLDLIEPGVVQVPRWRPRSELEASAPAALWGGMARKPA
ncbi:SAM-dependent methyltransferase [Actinomadura sp. K4S16]|uniref:SAM-dependent methyltransferase n=1 Tax=Actinomadura sp. K4S16 TaxID=1316147 RepID=UPI0011EEAA61|nr:SAM-dependent methyltransferase [Actinomadura sp. K4S16]